MLNLAYQLRQNVFPPSKVILVIRMEQDFRCVSEDESERERWKDLALLRD